MVIVVVASFCSRQVYMRYEMEIFSHRLDISHIKWSFSVVA